MPELLLHVPQAVVDDINRKLRAINGNNAMLLSVDDIGREAIARYKWTVEQIDSGKAVVATNKARTELSQLATPALPARPPRA